jgi:uncharacterized protein (DUF4415 family)
MKPSKAVNKGRKATPKKAQKSRKTPATISLQAVAEEPKPKRRYVLLRNVGVLYRPIKKPVTLRLDADVIAWFKKSGRGYQTRINRALRKMMEDEVKASGDSAGIGLHRADKSL